MAIFRKKLFTLLAILAVAFSLVPLSSQALTYNEIVAAQTGGKVLGDSTTANPAPTGLQYQCNTAGNQVTLTWNSVSSANFYLFRLNDTSDDSASTTQWGWYNAGTTDVNNDDVPQTTYTTAVVSGHSYAWWVHSYFSASSTASDPAYGATFTCSPPAPATPSPTGLQYQCNSAGNQVSLSWNAVSGANNYLLRVNYTSDDSSASQGGWYDPNTTDVSADNVSQTSYTTTVIPGKPYTWWVHAQINGVASSPSLANFTCNAPAAPVVAPAAPTGLSYQCNAQANQATMSWSPVTGADFYLFRLNDTSNDNSSAAQWNWYVPGTTDLSADHVTQTTYTAPVTAGTNYIWWVQSYVSATATSSAATFGGFTCTAQQATSTTINVKNFGAKGDGITDDAPAIQSAINQASGGSTIYIPAGTYMLGTSAGSPSNFSNGQPMQTALWLKASNVIFKGDGASSILELMPHKKMRILTLTGDYDTVDSIVADGNKSQRNGTVGYPDGDVVDGLIVGESYRQHLTVQNCEVRNAIETGIGFWQNSYALVQNCYSHDNGTAQAGGSGIDLSGGLDNKAIGNRLIGNTYGVWSSFGSNGTEIRNNTIENNTHNALALGGFDQTGGDKNFIVDGNTISGNGWAAIAINYVQGGTLTNNQVTNNTYDGIQIYDTVTGQNSTNWDIENNTCSNQLYGIRIIGAAKNLTIKNNTCQNNGKSLADQIVVDPQAQANSDWQTANSLSYSSSNQTSTTTSSNTPIPIPTPPVTHAPITTTTPASSIPTTNANNPTALTAYPYPSGSLVNDSGTIYAIRGTTKIPFTNWQAFVGLGYSTSNVVSGNLSAYIPSTSYFITSASADHPWGSWLLYGKTIYYSTQAGMIPVASWDTFVNNGGQSKFIVRANVADISIIKNNTLPVMQLNDSRVTY